MIGFLLLVGVLGVLALRWYSQQVPDPAVHTAAPGPPGLSRALAGAEQRLPLDRLVPTLAGQLGALLAEDDFTGPNGLFDNPSNQPGRVAYEGGDLLMAYQRGDADSRSAIEVVAARPTSFSNGVVAVQARLAAGGDQAGFAILFRRSERDQNGYALWVRPRGRTLQLLKQHGGQRSELTQVQTEALTPTGDNQITLVARDADLQVFVNGTLALTARDEAFTGGRLALAVGLIAGGPPGEVRVRFDDFRVVSLS